MPKIVSLLALVLAIASLIVLFSRGFMVAGAESMGPVPAHEALCIPGGDCTAFLVGLNDGNTVERSDGQFIQLTWSNKPSQPIIPPGSLISDVTLTVRARETDPEAAFYLRSGDDTLTLATVTDWGLGGFAIRDIRSANLTSYIRDQFEARNNLQLRLVVFAESSAPAALTIDYIALTIVYTPNVQPTPRPGQDTVVVPLVAGRCNPIAITYLPGTTVQTVAEGLNPPALQSLEAFWDYNPFLDVFLGWSPTAPPAANDLVSVESFLEVWFACIKPVAGSVTITMPGVR